MRKASALLESRGFEECLGAVSHLEQVARVAREADRSLSQELSAMLKANGYEVLR